MSSAAPNAKIIFMDAGQGDATLIVCGKRRILIDCGSSYNTDVVKKTIGAIFTTEGVYASTDGGLHALILTHPDMDHYNLVQALLIDKNVPIGHLYFGGTAGQYTVNSLSTWLANPGGITVTHPLDDEHFSSDIDADLSGGGMDVRIVAANVVRKANTAATAKNMNSIVVFVTYDDATFLLMGDSFKETENWIIQQDQRDDRKEKKNILTNLVKRNGRKASVLKVGHHGSGTSTGADWLNWANPKAAFISSDTRTFRGTSTCLKEVIDSLLAIVIEGGANNKHAYVQYNKGIQRHEPDTTTKWLYTNLNSLKLTGEVVDGKELFQAAGVSYYYTIDVQGHHAGVGGGTSFYAGSYDNNKDD